MRVTQTTGQELNSRQAETVERVVAAAQHELREVGWYGPTGRCVADRAGSLP